MPLLWVLRDLLGLTGTKFGCGIGQCGACTVLLNDQPVRSCSLPVLAVGERTITTIENQEDAELNALRDAWEQYQVPQCGYCQSGQLMTATGMLKDNAEPSEEEIVQAMKGNLCRCGTYPRIKKALQHLSTSRP